MGCPPPAVSTIWRNESSIKVNPSTNKSVPYIPSNNTLRKEATFIKQMFEYAVDKGWCSSIPNMDVPPLDKNRRPTFTPIEWRKLTRLLREWVKEGAKWGHVGRDRFLVHQYVLLLANCGARVGEFRFLRWNDLETNTLDDGTKRVVANVIGKTGERRVVFNEGSVASSAPILFCLSRWRGTAIVCLGRLKRMLSPSVLKFDTLRCVPPRAIRYACRLTSYKAGC